jgi:hypothetical protein
MNMNENLRNSSDARSLQNQEMSFQQVSRIVKKPTQNRVKPKFYKLLGQIMNLHIDVILYFKIF